MSPKPKNRGNDRRKKQLGGTIETRGSNGPRFEVTKEEYDKMNKPKPETTSFGTKINTGFGNDTTTYFLKNRRKKPYEYNKKK